MVAKPQILGSIFTSINFKQESNTFLDGMSRLRTGKVMIDRVGEVWNHWTLIKFDHISPDGKRYFWLCECDCANKTQMVVRYDGLRSGHSKSCGCHKREVAAKLAGQIWKDKRDEPIGQRFMELVVVKFHSSRSGHAFYECLCDCGNDIVASIAHLKQAHVKSCGNHREGYQPKYPLKKFPDGQAAKIAAKRQYISGATNRNLEWTLTDDEFYELTAQDCFYCGKSPFNVIKMKTGDFIYNGIDRVDNTKGYFIDNVVPCCQFCNRAKMNRTFEEFMLWVKDITLFNMSRFGEEEKQDK